METPASFIDLAESDLRHWVTAFLDASASAPSAIYGVRFPLLRPGISPSNWLRDQFHSARPVAGAQDHIRRPVVELLETEVSAEQVFDRSQVLGSLLEVAVDCGFTEIGDKLAKWVAADAYGAASYRISGERIPLRRTIWAILIAWGRTRPLRRYLLRDFERPELGCAQLCFAELGRHDPAAAIARIPRIFAWPHPYWSVVLHSFLSELGAAQAVGEEFRDAWKTCLADMAWDRAQFEFLTSGSPFVDVLQKTGILYGIDQKGWVISLRLIGDPLVGLTIDYGRLKEHENNDYYRITSAAEMARNQARFELPTPGFAFVDVCPTIDYGHPREYKKAQDYEITRAADVTLGQDQFELPTPGSAFVEVRPTLNYRRLKEHERREDDEITRISNELFKFGSVYSRGGPRRLDGPAISGEGWLGHNAP